MMNIFVLYTIYNLLEEIMNSFPYQLETATISYLYSTFEHQTCWLQVTHFILYIGGGT